MVVKTTPILKGFYLLISLVLLIPLGAIAQNEMAIGSTSTKSNAILWLNGNGSQGLLLPVVTNKSAVASPEKGLLVYDDSDSKVWYRNGSTWVEVGGGATTGGVTSVTGTGAVTVTNSTTTPVISIASAGISNALIANDAVTTSKILDATITGADIANVTITANKLAQSSATTGQVLKWNGTNWVPQNDDTAVGAPILGNGQILVGNGLINSATTLTGDATLAGGAITLNNNAVSGGTAGKITDGTITDADVATTAAIAVSKLSIGSSGQVLTTVGGVPTWQVPTAGTDAQDLSLSGTTLSLANDATPVVLGGLSILNSVSTTEITDATITNTDISSTAAIAVTKVAPGANGQVLTTVGSVPTWSAASTGTVTSVSNGVGLIGGPITSTGTLAVDVGTTANKIVQLDGTAKLPVLDGSQLISLNATNISTGTLSLNRIPAGANGDVLTTTAGIPTWQALAAGATTLDGLTDATVSAPASGQLLVHDGAGQFRNVGVVGDATISSAGTLTINNGAVSGGVGGKITDATISAADLAPNAVSGGTGGVIADATITDADIASGAAIAVAKLGIGANGQVLTTVGGIPTWQVPAAATDAQDLSLAGTTLSLANDATPVVLGGLSILNSVTTTEITDGAIMNGDISPTAAIAVTKVAAGGDGQVLTTVGGIPTWQALAAGVTALDGLTDAAVTAPASGQLLVNDGAGQFRNVSMSGDAAISGAGALTINNGAISGGVGGKITDATITSSDLAAGAVSGGVGGVIVDASVTNDDISSTAAIAITKVAAGTNGDILTTVGGIPTWQAPAAGVTTLDGLTDATVSAPATGQLLVNDGAGQFRNVGMSGDAAISGSGALTINNGAISGGVGGKITDATITSADLANGSVDGGVGGIITDATITDADIAVAAAIAGTKISPNFGAQNVSTTGTATAGGGVTVGASSQFTISGAGDITKINNITTSFPAIQGLSGSLLTNDGSGNLTWSSPDNGWSLLGNSGTVDGTNFIGTTDNTPLTIRVNNEQSGRIEILGGNASWGYQAGNLTTGLFNTAIGGRALALNTSGRQNTAVGQGALNNNTGDYNTAVGQAALITNTTGTLNTGVGLYALDQNLTGSSNTAMGTQALFNNNGDENTAVGANALITNVDGVYNTAIGAFADVSSPNLTNATAVGYKAIADASNSIVLGGTGVYAVSVGIGLTAPTATLDIAGDIKIADGTQGAGKVLTSDVNGLASWQPAGAGSGWSLTGNAGTVNGTNFIGTTDGQDLSFKVNGLESGRISVNDQHGVFFGLQAGELQTEGSALLNTGLGAKALWLNVTGDNNTAVGQGALLANKASNNTAMGQGALGNNVDGIDNTAVGALALQNNNNIAGNENTAIGKGAMDTNTSGFRNTVIGKDADVTANNLQNATALGYNALVNANNKVRIGNTSVTVIEGQVAFTAASDIRFKKDIKNIDTGLDLITKLRPVSYRMKNDGSKKINWGFIAQDIESLVGTENAVLTIGEDEDRTLGLRYSDFVAPLVKSVQELNAKIEQLEAENLKLKTTLSEVLQEKENLKSENGLLESKVNTIQNDVDEIKRILSLKASKN